MSKTPRTDAEWDCITVTAPWDAAAEQMAQHARQLECELTVMQAQRDKLLDVLYLACDNPSSGSWVYIATRLIEDVEGDQQ